LVVPDATMMYTQRDPRIRAEIIAYLKAQS